MHASQENIAETHFDRAAAVMKCFGSGATMSRRPPPGTTFTTESLLHHEHGGGSPGEDKITVVWAVRESKSPNKTNPDLGTSAKRWAVSLPLPDIKAHLVATVNIEWGRSNSTLLLNEEVTFRFHGGKLLEPDTANMTLGQFYSFYSTPSRAPIYLTNIPTQWKQLAKTTRGSIIFLELYIDSIMFKNRIEMSDGHSSTDSLIDSVLDSSVKRKRTLSSVSEGANRNISMIKRPAPMKSMFVPTNAGSVKVHQRSSITLKKIICIADSVTGKVEFEETTELISGTIRDEPFGHGAMKNAYQFNPSNGNVLVAKRFYRISDSEDDGMAPPLSVLDNQDQIYLELHRLTIAAHFLKAFFLHAKQCGTDVYTGILFHVSFSFS
ncbi:hypothetical protein MSAN_01947400 [Mycena sanguinolenta]|uniref:Uncharacterized protein n=1 Tax=Mycena sanguinolenta TaxID=230812 RepID=A0A8H7CPN0_9AGAR|nr:hypothetical protein MSAN_01947400 [Mycena sanguinolenta]